MMIKGMDCARINTAHGDFNQYANIIKTLRELGDIPIMLDIKGPEIRIRCDTDIQIKAKEEKTFFFDKKNAHNSPYFSYDFSGSVSKGNLIFFDNGSIKAKILSVKKGKHPSVSLKFERKCTIMPNKGVNIPGKRLKIPSLSAKDKKAVSFAIKNKLSFIALSFTRDKSDILDLKRLIKNSGINIIAKIENQEGIDNIDEIIEASDGIMIARGDLGVEIPAEKIPLLQKQIVQKCNSLAKIVIVATQMLESMTYSPMATRAEVSDVANAVLDGTDAVMLSGETASGLYPAKTVEVMERINKEIESKTQNNIKEEAEEKSPDFSRRISYMASSLAASSKASKMICITRSGFTAKLISRFKPSAPIIVVTDSYEVMLQLKIVWGILPVFISSIPKKSVIGNSAQYLFSKGCLKNKDIAVFVGGVNTDMEKVSNLVEIHKIDDLLKFNKHIKK